jgi:hypothetical protein
VTKRAVVGRGFVNAGDLKLGDRLQSAEGKDLTIVGLRDLPDAIPVFNFEVAEFHTYFVGDSGAWVHNCPYEGGEGGGRPGRGAPHREKTRGANRSDARQIDDAAREAGVDRRGFGKFIEQEKKAGGRGASENFTFEELLELAREFAAGGG